MYTLRSLMTNMSILLRYNSMNFMTHTKYGAFLYPLSNGQCKKLLSVSTYLSYDRINFFS